jgi:hypothetical protein
VQVIYFISSKPESTGDEGMAEAKVDRSQPIKASRKLGRGPKSLEYNKILPHQPPWSTIVLFKSRFTREYLQGLGW